MKPGTLILFLSAALLPLSASAKKPVNAYPATYTGGNLPLRQDKVHAALDHDQVVITQGDQRIAVPAKNITDISCGVEVHRRTGAFVLSAVPLMHLGTRHDHYIGMAWSDAAGNAARAQVVLKLSADDYSDFLAALQQVTGVKAVNTNQVPTVVRYGL